MDSKEQAKTKALETTVARLEKMVAQLLLRCAHLEKDVHRLKHASHRHHAQLLAHDRKFHALGQNRGD